MRQRKLGLYELRVIHILTSYVCVCSTVARAQRARDNYKTFCETFYDETDEHDMYAADKLIDRVCRFLEGMALMTQGRLQEKVKVSTLMQCRQALEWWIKEFTPTFSTFQLLFETRTTRHIHMVAVKQNLSTEFREKNNLGEFELGMFYNQIMLEEHKRIDNFKQHYTAWVLSFITGARPGSFTVSPYYRKGAPLGGAVSDSMPARAESHTLRWSDITFERMKNGIACRLTFRFLKGYQHPYRAQYVMGSREWFFPPKKTQLHLDVSLLLFLLAVERGLFKGSWEEILSGSDHIIKKNKDVDRQAVFVSADTNGKSPSLLSVRLQKLIYQALSFLQRTWGTVRLIPNCRTCADPLAYSTTTTCTPSAERRPWIPNANMVWKLRKS